MANLRQMMDQSDPNGNLFGDQPSPEDDGGGRKAIMPVPANEPPLSETQGHDANQKGQAGETPRERGQAQQTGNGGNDPGTQFLSAPRQPQVPSPMAGTESMGTGGGVIPFAPMGGPDPTSTASPRLRSLYGGAGGLIGGGLGVPLDPIANEQSDPINMLMQLLQGRGQA